jgi:hypothetical protein
VEFNPFDGSEGSVPEMSRKSDWEDAVRKLVAGGNPPRMAALIRLKSYGDMTLDDHFSTWSMIDFLYRTRRDGLAQFLQALKGRTNEEGFPDGSNLPDVHRDLFKEHLGMSYSQFDTAWSEWVLLNY